MHRYIHFSKRRSPEYQLELGLFDQKSLLLIPKKGIRTLNGSNPYISCGDITIVNIKIKFA